MKKAAKRSLLNNFWLKLLALILAVIIWLIVVNVDDYMVTKTIKDIPVEELNGDTLDKLGQIYTVTSGETVDISVKGPRSVVERMKPEDFYASADLSQLSVTNTAEINVELRENASNVTITRLNTTMTLSLEEKGKRELPVNVVTVGTVRDGYDLGSPTAKPNLVTIEGAASVLENVTEVRAVVDVDKAYSTLTKEVSVSCFDTYGESMEKKKITLSEDTVLVTVPVYPTKEVEVKVDTVGNPAEGYSVTDIHFNPQTIRIAGEPENLKEISEILINDISVEGISDTLEENVRVDDYLPAGVRTADDGAQIAVSIDVEKQEVKSIPLSPADVSVIGANGVYNYSVSFSGNITVEVAGLSSDLEAVTLAKLNPRVDAIGLTPGQYPMQLTFTEEKTYKISDVYSVILTIEEKTTEE